MKRLTVISGLMRRWHKQIGIFAASFFVFLACTGLLLNHADLIGIDKTDIKAAWLMHWYGLKTEVPDHGFRQNGAISAFSDAAWVVAGAAVDAGHGNPVGVILLDDNYWIATPGVVSIYQRGGQLVDRMDMSTLPALPIRRIGVRRGKAVIESPRGTFESSDGLNWAALRTGDGSDIAWSRAEQLTPAEKRALAADFAPELPTLRILSDLHSGHIWGRYGMLVTDSIAAALLLLAFSGAWTYLRSSALRRTLAQHLTQTHPHGERKPRPHPVPGRGQARHNIEEQVDTLP